MADRIVGRKKVPARKLKKEPILPALPSPADGHSGDSHARSQLEKGIAELQVLHKLLLSSEIDPEVLADFRDALNRVRNAAWGAHQYIVRKDNDQSSTNVHSVLVGERIRAAYQLCQSLADDLMRTDIQFQRGSLIELHDATKNLTKQLKRTIDKF